MTDLLTPDLNDKRLEGEVVEELLGNWVDTKVLGVAKAGVAGSRNGHCLCFLRLQIELVLAIHSLGNEREGRRVRYVEWSSGWWGVDTLVYCEGIPLACGILNMKFITFPSWIMENVCYDVIECSVQFNISFSYN